jgi:hypothetical protein
MGRKSKNVDAVLWWTLGQCAGVFGVTKQGFAVAVRPLLQPQDVRGRGKSLRVDVAAAVHRFVEAKVAKAVEASAADPMLVGAASPALEEYRQHRAKLASMDVADREKTHADLGQLDSAVKGLAGRILNTTGDLRRRFGPDAAEIIEDAAADAMDQWRRR